MRSPGVPCPPSTDSSGTGVRPEASGPLRARTGWRRPRRRCNLRPAASFSTADSSAWQSRGNCRPGACGHGRSTRARCWPCLSTLNCSSTSCSSGEQARVLPHVPPKLLVSDRRDAVVPLTAGADGLRSTTPWSTGHRRATPSSTSSRPAGSRPPRVRQRAQETDDHPDLIEADCALLHLLHAGLKDETIAPQLGLSERTLRRRITDLTTRLGATTRFQAGAQAVRCGWL